MHILSLGFQVLEFFLKYHFGIFSLIHQNEEVGPGGYQEMSPPELYCVSLQSCNYVDPSFCLAKYHFDFFCGCLHDHKKCSYIDIPRCH